MLYDGAGGPVLRTGGDDELFYDSHVCARRVALALLAAPVSADHHKSGMKAGNADLRSAGVLGVRA